MTHKAAHEVALGGHDSRVWLDCSCGKFSASVTTSVAEREAAMEFLRGLAAGHLERNA